MKYKIRKTKYEEVEINEFPAYFEFGGCHAIKVTENKVLNVCWLNGHEGIEIQKYITDNEWQPCAPELFYQKFADVNSKIMDLANIELLELEGGAYAD
jgi:hypothetical protein